MYGHAKIAYDVSDSSREEWLKLRRKGLGASDVAAILGFSDHTSPADVWRDKVMGPQGEEWKFSSERGKALESTLIEWYRREYDVDVNDSEKILQHPEYDFLRCTLDSWDLDLPGPIECKTTTPRNHAVLTHWRDEKEIIDGSKAEYYYVQGQTQLAVTGAESLVFVVYTGFSPWVLQIERDEETIDRIIRSSKAFWEHYIVAENPLPPEYQSPGIAKRVYELETDDTITIQDNSDPARLVEKYKLLGNKKSRLKKKREEIKCRLFEHLDGNKKLRSESGHVQITRGSNDRLYLTYKPERLD